MAHPPPGANPAMLQTPIEIAAYVRKCQEHGVTPRLDWIISRNGQTARLPCVNRSVGCGARVRVSEG